MTHLNRIRTIYKDEALQFLKKYQPISAFKLARKIQALCKLGIYTYDYSSHYHLYARVLKLFHELEKDGIVEHEKSEWFIK